MKIRSALPTGSAVLCAVAVLTTPATPFAGLAAQVPDAPLFRSHEPIRMTVAADLRALKGDRGEDPEERPGVARIEVPGADVFSVRVDLRTRGNFRLERTTCEFPPLRFDFPTGDLEGTPLEGENRLKVVTHCRDNDRSEQDMLEEYLAYRIYNEITDDSFRVRLARITWIDISGRDDPVERWGFLIESDEAVAARMGGTESELEEIAPAAVPGMTEGRVTIFQYMIGNTDFSIYQLHNVLAVERANGVIPVPYDFDWSGLVDARYAVPDPTLFETRTVEERVFRGLCREDVDYDRIFRAFEERRAAIEGVVSEFEPLSRDNRSRALDYLEEFYEVIGDPANAEYRIIDRCRVGRGG